MYARAGEYEPANAVFSSPQHTYTWGLLGSMPRWDRQRTQRLAPILGSAPSLINIPPGCPFYPRCPYAELDERRAHILDDEIRPML